MIKHIKRRIPIGFKLFVLKLIRHVLGEQEVIDKARSELRERAAKVSSAKTIDDVRRIANEIGFSYFQDYDKQIETKRREFISAINYFKLDLVDRVVLDVGPGTADSLDHARELGAARTLFIEEEPLFVRFAELKGHEGINKNYTFAPYFPIEWKKEIDFIYSKGSINCDWVNSQQKMSQEHGGGRYFDFDAWITSLLGLLNPVNGAIILVPAMPRQSERIIDSEYDLDTYYWCPDLNAYRESFFCRKLIERGFIAVENVQGFTQEKAFPLAFFYSNVET